MRRASLPALLSLCILLLAAAAPHARAEIMASGTRLSIAGSPPRAYMTYGHAEEPELYAPVTQELRRLQITFQRRGDECLVFHRGTKVAEWPVVTSRAEVPETGNEACILVMGGNVFVPIRALSELCSFEVKWQEGANLLALVPGTPRGGPRVAAEPLRSDEPVVLSGITLEEKGSSLEIRVRASGAIRPTLLNLKHLPPPRIVLDFPNARWAADLKLPAASGPVKQLRTGQFNETTARLVLEVASGAMNLTGLRVDRGEVAASVGLGQQVAQASIAPEAEAQIREIIRRRTSPLPTRASARSGDGFTPPGFDPGQLFPGVPATSLSGRVIVVDAGHGGDDPGAKGLFSLEKDLCLQMARELRRSLEARGARVIMTRDGDVYVSLSQRVQIANSSGADLFISIHCNSMVRRNTASGSQTYWRTPHSQRLAKILHRRMVMSVRGYDGGTRGNRGFYVIRNTTMPSVLLEVAFINNTEDEKLLASPPFHGELAESLAHGVLEYFGSEVAAAPGR